MVRSSRCASCAAGWSASLQVAARLVCAAHSATPHLLAEPAWHAVSQDALCHHVLLADVVTPVEKALILQAAAADLSQRDGQAVDKLSACEWEARLV